MVITPIRVTADYHITQTGYALLICLQSAVETLLAWPGIEPSTLDLSCKSSAFDHSARMLFNSAVKLKEVSLQLMQSFDTSLKWLHS